jgi:uncharacterized damage-inducible protein DinB
MKELLVKYTRYNLWANKKVCDFLTTLSEEQLNREIISSFPSLMKTVLHSWDAQFIWINRLHGTSLTVFPSKNFTGTFEEAANGLLETSREIIRFVETGKEDLLNTSITYKNIAGDEFKNSVSDIIQHVVNHGTFHRGQIITMLRQSGFTKLFPTDYIAFCRE